MEVVHPSLAAKVKREALGKESMAPLRERGIEPDQTISREGIKALLKKTPEELSSRRLSNFLSIFPGKLGRTEWTGSSHLQDIKKLADKYQTLPSHALHEKMEVLERLTTALESYGSQTTKARLEDRITNLKDFVRGEMIGLQAKMAEPGLHDLGPELIGSGGLLDELREPFILAVETGRQDALDGIVEDMTHRLVVDLRAKGVDGKKFAGSDGATFKAQFCGAFLGLNPEKGTPEGDRVLLAMDRLYTGVVNGLNEGHGTVDFDGQLTFGQVDYTPQGGFGTMDRPVSEGGAFLGDGGYGKVFVFDGTDGGKVVVKEPRPMGDNPNPTAKELRTLARDSHREAEMHSLAQGTEGHENLVRFEGSVYRGKNTTVCVEYCPNGDMDKMGKKLSHPEILRELPLEQQERVRDRSVGLMSRDMARGLSFIHRNGVGHLDFKGANVFIGGDGVAKVGDLGTGVRLQDGRYHIPLGHQFVDAPSYVSPELLELRETPPHQLLGITGFVKDWVLSVDLDQYEQAYAALSHPAPLQEFQRVKEALRELQGRAERDGLGTRELAAAWRELITPVDDLVKGLREVPGILTGQTLDANKADVWALGITMCELAYPGDDGQSGSPFEGSRIETIDNIQEFARDGTKTFTQHRMERWERDHPGTIPPSNPRLDALLDKMLHPDPNQRITLEQVLEDPYLQDEVLDDPQVRDFVQKLTSSGSSKVEVVESAKRVSQL